MKREYKGIIDGFHTWETTDEDGNIVLTEQIADEYEE